MGLLEVRTARMRPDGVLEAGATVRLQRRFWFLGFQALPWAEATFRFAERLNGTTGRGTTTDRSFDVKARLIAETDWLPEVSVGLQDAIGTGIYAGEYVVGSKRFGPFDVSLGVGWGRLGSAGDFTNPARAIDRRFRERRAGVGEGGTLRFNNWFHGGEVALFGGVEWTTPWPALRLKLEYSGDRLRDERRGGRGRAESRWNVGLVYAPADWIEVQAGFLHGTDAVVRVSVMLDPANPPASPLRRPPPVMAPRPGVPFGAAGVPVPGDVLVAIGPRDPVPAAPALPPAALDEAAVLAALRQAGFRPLLAERRGGVARIAVADGPFRTFARAAMRVARAVNGLLPGDIGTLEIGWWQSGAEMGRVLLPRDVAEAAADGTGSAEEVVNAARIDAADGTLGRAGGPAVSWFVAPRLDLQVMDPDTRFRGDLRAAAGARIDVGAGFALAGSVSRTLVGNLDQAPPSDSRIERVRSDVARYAREGRTALTTLYAERLVNVAPDVFARATFGYLEPMFAGGSAEVLWRPADQPWAIGLDLNAVRQRDFDQRLGLRDYGVITGHVSLYADLPLWNLTTTLRAGRYLAGDWGGTVEVARRFDSGIEVGGYFTLTTVTPSRFGEGSFDKGLFVRFPFDLFGLDTRQRGAINIRPLQRDGGQRLVVDSPLWDVSRDGRAVEWVRGVGTALR